jgi:UPF0176 protein
MQEFEIILFYKYVHIANPEKLAEEQRVLQTRLGLKGRTIIATEGINATLEGTKANVQEYLKIFLADPRFTATHIKRSNGTGSAFPKTSVKVRPEIVSLGLGKCDIDPNKSTGKRLSPAALHEWINTKKEFYIVDMRNAYEHQVGHFKQSLMPPLDNFRDLPKFLKSIEHLKHKTVLTVCTGGVRCEKASGYLLEHGFLDVYQLDGGIVSYMQEYPNEDFVGKLYVFDNRMMMGFYTDDPKHEVVGRCALCQNPTERFSNCQDIDCHRQLLVCQDCESALGQKLRCPVECKQTTRVRTQTRSPILASVTAGKKIITRLEKRAHILYGKYVKRPLVRLGFS